MAKDLFPLKLGEILASDLYSYDQLTSKFSRNTDDICTAHLTFEFV